MRTGIKIPLKYKFLSVLLFIMFLSLGIFFSFAVSTFSEDKKLFVMDLNMAILKAETSEVKLELKSRLEELQVFVPRVYNPSAVGLTEKNDPYQGLPPRMKEEVLSVAIYRRIPLPTPTAGFVATPSPSSAPKPTIAPSKMPLSLLKHYKNSALLAQRELTENFFKTIDNTSTLQRFLEGGSEEILNRSVRVNENGRPVPIGVLTFILNGTFINDESKDVFVIVDLTNDFLRKELQASESSDVFLIYNNGTLLAHPNLSTTIDYATTPIPHPVVSVLSKKQLPREALELQVNNEPYLCNISDSGFKNIFIISQTRKGEAFRALQVLLEKSAILAVLILALAIIFSILFASKLTSNIRKLKSAAEKIGTGNLKVKIDIRSNDEVESVAESFQWMADRIKQLISETAEKARLEDELETARLVQSTLLTPPEVHTDTVELAHHYLPATECGGDFWDAHITNDTITVFIGDATGHGAPAAIVTAVAKSCFSTLGMIYQGQVLTPEQLLTILNQIVYGSCKGKLLMTMCIVQLNLKTGELTVCNAGHESPLCLSKGVNQTGRSADKKRKPDVLFARGERLGFNPDAEYQSEQFQLQLGDTVLLYTDGISEAKDSDGKEWGERSLKKALGEGAGKSPPSIKHRIIEALNAHTGEAQQADDITFVLLQWKRVATNEGTGNEGSDPASGNEAA